MKRIIPFLLLAFVAVACERDGPTVPVDGPQLARDGKGKPDKPGKPGGGGGGGDTGAYDAIPLGSAKALSWAGDLSDTTADVRLITGYTEGTNGDPIATLWTVTGTSPNKTTLPQRSGRPSTAPGINDEGTIFVGFDAEGMGGGHFIGKLPLVWNSPSATPKELELPTAYDDGGYAEDVNNSGTIVGTSFDDYFRTRATVWDGDSVMTLASFDTSGSSVAFSINNDGYVVGYGTTANANYPPRHAMLWRPDGSSCDLHEQSELAPDIKTDAVGISDVLNNTVLIVGGGDSGSWIWQGNPADCESFQLLEKPADVEFHGVNTNWEAAGKTTSGKPHPVYFDLTGTLTSVGDAPGVATEINLAGDIVGWVDSKGSEIAMLWIPKQ